MNSLQFLAGDPTTFATEVWGRRLLVRHIPPADLDGVFGIEQADRLITSSALRTPQLRLAKDGSVLAESRYTRHATIAGKPMTGLVDPRKVIDLFTDGATIVFQGLQRYWDPLRRLVRGLEEELGHPCQANAYLTPPGSQGFALHKDTHDVFVFQTFGTKDWEVHDDSGAHQVLMEPGTCMYLPTGTPHMARTQATASLHVTVGINRFVWRDLLRKVVEPALADEAFAGPLPARLFDDTEALAAALRAKVDELTAALAGADLDGLVRAEEVRFESGRQPLLEGALLDRLELSRIDAQTVLRRRAGSTCVVRPAGDDLRLLLGDRSMTVPRRIGDAVRRVAATDGELRPADLRDVLGDESALVLCRRFVREGLLEVVR